MQTQHSISSNGIMLVLVVVVLMYATVAQAQHTMHDMGGNSAIDMHSMPANDAVLADAPGSLMLHYAEDVRLVKLALRDPASGLVDIGFRYQPLSGKDFLQQLPSLPEADYYAVEWAVLDASDTLIKGNFHFAFGDDARPPSYYLDQMEEMRHFMAPDYRLLDR